MVKRSRARVEREFSSEQVIGETLAVYRSLADTEASEKQCSWADGDGGGAVVLRRRHEP
jgi:hypothetical protein